MAKNQEYQERVKQAVEHLHKCSAVHVETVPVHERFEGQTVWQGEVEIFDLTDHPKLKRAYTWSRREGKDNRGERFIAVLEIPSIKSAADAVKGSLVKEAKGK